MVPPASVQFEKAAAGPTGDLRVGDQAVPQQGQRAAHAGAQAEGRPAEVGVGGVAAAVARVVLRVQLQQGERQREVTPERAHPGQRELVRQPEPDVAAEFAETELTHLLHVPVAPALHHAERQLEAPGRADRAFGRAGVEASGATGGELER